MCGGLQTKRLVFKNWMMSLNVHLKSQKQKVLLIMDNCATHSLKQVGRG